MRSDLLAFGFALVLFAIRPVVLSSQGTISQTSVAMYFLIAIFFFAFTRPSTDVITGLSDIRTSSSGNRLVKIKREEQPFYYAFTLLIPWTGAIALAIFMFSVDLSGMEFTRVKQDISRGQQAITRPLV